MVDIEKWLKEALEKLKEQFNERLMFVGLQGSYARGEATEESDIDIVVVLNELSISDLQAYRKIVQDLPYPEKACGFVSGRDEIANWPKSWM